MKTMKHGWLLAICLSLSLVSGLAPAVGPEVVVGEVRGSKDSDVAVQLYFKKAVYQSVAGLDTRSVKGGPFMVSASLRQLSSKEGTYGIQATAVVETTLLHAKSGALIGMTTGRATAAVQGGKRRDAEESAVSSATENALKNVPAALASR